MYLHCMCLHPAAYHRMPLPLPQPPQRAGSMPPLFKKRAL